MIPVWKSEELASLIPRAELTIVDGQGHGVMWEAAGRFNAVITEFVIRATNEAKR